MPTDLTGWLATLKRREITAGPTSTGRVVLRGDGVTDVDRAWLARYHGALAEAGRRPAWWRRVLDGGDLGAPPRCSVLGCREAADHYDLALAPYCYRHAAPSWRPPEGNVGMTEAELNYLARREDL